jgi:uncharacterized membrane protein YozB (DUF420 family)
MLAVHPLAHLNAALNATAAMLLVAGYVLIRQGREAGHKRAMLAAFTVSVAFLVSYLSYHFGVLGATTTRFAGQGLVRMLYFSILISHTALAATVPLLALVTLFLGLRIPTSSVGQAASTSDGGLSDDRRLQQSHAARRRHRRVARWTFPVWLYVSVSGVVVYLMLYHLQLS